MRTPVEFGDTYAAIGAAKATNVATESANMASDFVKKNRSADHLRLYPGSDRLRTVIRAHGPVRATREP